MANKPMSLSPCKNGICPVCRAKVTHTETEQCETSTQLYWECPECHCTGEENYEHIFSIGIGDNTTGTYEHIEGEPLRPEDGWAYIC